MTANSASCHHRRRRDNLYRRRNGFRSRVRQKQMQQQQQKQLLLHHASKSGTRTNCQKACPSPVRGSTQKGMDPMQHTCCHLQG